MNEPATPGPSTAGAGPTVSSLAEELMPVATNWMILGGKLSLEEYELRIIDSENSTVAEKLMAALSKWLRKKPNASWTDIVCSLESMQENTLAEEIRKKHFPPGSGTTHAVPYPVRKLIESNYRKMKTKFFGLVGTVSITLNKKMSMELDEQRGEETFQLFRLHVAGFCDAESLAQKRTVLEIFATLRTMHYWDLNGDPYELLLGIAEAAGDKEIIKTVQKHQQEHHTQYLVTTKIADYIACQRVEPVEPILTQPDWVKLSVKLGGVNVDENSLNYLTDLWKNLKSCVSLPDLYSILASIEEGCVSVTWLVPTYAIPALTRLPKLAPELLIKHDVTSIHINGICIYMVSTRAMADSHEFAAFQCAFSSLQEGIKYDLNELVSKLFAKNLISSTNRDRSLSQTDQPGKRAAHLLTVLESRIRGDPASFHSILQELDSCPTLKFLAAKLRSELERVKASHTKPSHKRVRESESMAPETKRIKREGEPQQRPSTEVYTADVQFTALHGSTEHRVKHEYDQYPQQPYGYDYYRDYEALPDEVDQFVHNCCCPNKSDKGLIELQNLEHQEECPLKIVECDFHYAGCGVKLPRIYMAGHLAESLVAHMSLLATHGKKTAADAQKALEDRDRQIAHLREDIHQKDHEMSQMQEEMKELKDRLHSHLLSPPVTFTMSNFEQHKRNKDTWYSPPFYTHPHGYKMSVKVLFEDDNWFVGANLMQGEFDDCLQWPFQSDVYIRILNQLSDDNHIIINGKFSSSPNIGMRVTVGERHEYGRGKDIPYATLNSHGDSTENCQYLRDNCIQVQVARVVDTVQLQREIVAIVDHRSLRTPPCQFIMRDFEQHKKDGDKWYSPSFFTHPQGYRMCLGVHANGHGEGMGTHVSVFNYLMCGEFDSHLKWPFQGNITIQLLNHLEDKQHHTMTSHYTDTTPDSSAGRVTVGERGHGWGFPKFIPLSELGLNQSRNCQYLKDDCLIFKITKIDLENTYRTALSQ